MKLAAMLTRGEPMPFTDGTGAEPVNVIYQSSEDDVEVSVRMDGIRVSGYANYAEKGSNIVCAGATALVQSLIKSIKDLTED